MNTTSKNDNGRVQAAEVRNTKKSQRKYNPRSTATAAQIQRLIELLRTRRHHTHELRKVGISHPAGRVNDLKKRGYVIAKTVINTVDSDGYTHVNVALYELVSEPEGASESPQPGFFDGEVQE